MPSTRWRSRLPMLRPKLMPSFRAVRVFRGFLPVEHVGPALRVSPAEFRRAAATRADRRAGNVPDVSGSSGALGRDSTALDRIRGGNAATTRRLVFPAGATHAEGGPDRTHARRPARVWRRLRAHGRPDFAAPPFQGPASGSQGDANPAFP